MKRLTIAVIILMTIMLNISYGQNSQNISHVKWLYSFWDNPQQVELQGDYAYLCTSRSGFQIIDMSNPNDPFVTGHLSGFGATDIDVENNFAYTTGRERGDIGISDISDPTTPELISMRRVDNYWTGGMTAGHGWFFNSCYLESGDGWFSAYLIRMWDITDPRGARYMGEDDRQEQLMNKMCNNSELLFYPVAMGLEVVELAAPHGMGDITIYGGIQLADLSVIDNHLLGVTIYNNFNVIDFSDPERPERESSVELNGEEPMQLFHDLNTVIVKSGSSILNFVDISDMDNPAHINTWESDNNLKQIAILDTTFVATTENGELLVFDWDQDSAELTATIDGRGNALDITIDGDFGYMCLGESGFWKTDISDPENPEELAVWDINVVKCYIFNEAAFVSTMDNRFYEIDTGDLESEPQLLPIEGDIIDFEYANSLYYVLYSNWMNIFDPQNMDEAIGVYRMPQGSEAFSLTYEMGLVYIGDKDRFRIIDVSDPEHPREFDVVGTRCRVTDISVSGNNLFAADSPERFNSYYYPSVWQYNIEDPTNPQFVGCYVSENCEKISSIKVEDDFLFVLGHIRDSAPGGNTQIEVVNISNPRRMSLLGWQRIPQGGLNFDVAGEYIYVANNWNFDIYDCSQSLNVEIHQERVVDDFTVLQTYPNPFNSTVKIEFSLAYDQFVGGSILDVKGRQVADLTSSGIMSQGKNTLMWDAEGYPSGIYLIKVNLNGITKVNQIVLQK